MERPRPLRPQIPKPFSAKKPPSRHNPHSGQPEQAVQSNPVYMTSLPTIHDDSRSAMRHHINLQIPGSRYACPGMTGSPYSTLPIFFTAAIRRAESSVTNLANSGASM